MIQCPHCKSDDSYKVSHVYLRSHKTIEATTTGWGLGFDKSIKPSSIEVGVGYTSGVIQSLEGQLLAPPKAPSNEKLGTTILSVYTVAIFYFFREFLEFHYTFKSIAKWVLLGLGIVFIIWMMNKKTAEEKKCTIKN